MKRRVIVLVGGLCGLALAACPPTMERLRLQVGVRVADVPGVTWTDGSWQGRAIRLRPCLGDPEGVGWPGLPGEVSPIPDDPDPPPWTIGIPQPLPMLPPEGFARGLAASWCAVDLVSRGTVRMEGEGPEGEVTVEIDLPDLEAVGWADAPHGAEPEEGVDPEALLVRLGGPVWAAALAALAIEGPVSVAPGGPDHDRLQALLVDEVEVFIDRDGDLAISDEDGPSWLRLRAVVPD